MNKAAHIFFPDEGSLSEKVSTYKSVSEAHSRAEQSLKFANDPKWADSLGARKEIEEAVRVTQNSLLIATNAISRADMQRVRKTELVNINRQNT